MCRATFLVVVVVFIKSNTAEDYTQAFLYTKPYQAVPTPTDFSDIFTNSIASDMDDSSYRSHLTPSTRFVDFQYATESPPKPSTTVPPPKIEHNITSPVIAKPTPKRQTIRLPINRKRKQKHPQRGILDLLFPEQRVKSFKTYFDAFKQLMSHTF